MPAYCAIDFGTSNSAVALPDGPGQVRLVTLEKGLPTMPTAVFYLNDPASPFDEHLRSYGRAAVAAYVEGADGRLMRSMKSILGSSLAEQATEVGPGVMVSYLDVIGGYLRRLKATAEAESGHPLHQVVMGRPVFFVDGEPERDAAAQASLRAAAHAVGFKDIHFQYEPIAAALDHELSVTEEGNVLVADIGGGTSDFSLVRIGPKRRLKVQRKDDILANHGVHIAGTDFDRHVELAAIMPLLGYRSTGPNGREVPSSVYFDLATWHLINTQYNSARVAELRRMRSFYADARLHERLMMVLTERLGHGLAAAAEQAKIQVAGAGQALIDLQAVEDGLQAVLTEPEAAAAIDADMQRIVVAAQETVRMAGLKPAQVQALYFTGGSTGLLPLVQRIAASFPQASVHRGDRFSSVARGLGLHAQRLFGAG